jgi:hypothetical protein
MIRKSQILLSICIELAILFALLVMIYHFNRENNYLFFLYFLPYNLFLLFPHGGTFSSNYPREIHWIGVLIMIVLVAINSLKWFVVINLWLTKHKVWAILILIVIAWFLLSTWEHGDYGS